MLFSYPYSFLPFRPHLSVSKQISLPSRLSHTFAFALSPASVVMAACFGGDGAPYHFDFFPPPSGGSPSPPGCVPGPA